MWCNSTKVRDQDMCVSDHIEKYREIPTNAQEIERNFYQSDNASKDKGEKMCVNISHLWLIWTEG